MCSPYGSTQVQICGPKDGVPLVLLPLPGGGATSVAWFAGIFHLARVHRVYAPRSDGRHRPQRARRSTAAGADDLMAWLDTLYDELNLDGAHLCGHSYDAWITLTYALHAPHRFGRLALLDPAETHPRAGASLPPVGNRS
jgi:pimeloyl-ACP methyl ester carboxylesterase